MTELPELGVMLRVPLIAPLDDAALEEIRGEPVCLATNGGNAPLIDATVTGWDDTWVHLHPLADTPDKVRRAHLLGAYWPRSIHRDAVVYHDRDYTRPMDLLGVDADGQVWCRRQDTGVIVTFDGPGRLYRALNAGNAVRRRRQLLGE